MTNNSELHVLLEYEICNAIILCILQESLVGRIFGEFTLFKHLAEKWFGK